MEFMRVQIVWILLIGLSYGISQPLRRDDGYIGRRLGYDNQRRNQFVPYTPGSPGIYGYKGSYDDEEIAFMGSEGDSIRVSLGYGDGQSYQKTIMITQGIPEPPSTVNKIGVPVQRSMEVAERRSYTVPTDNSYSAPVTKAEPYQKENKKVPFRIVVPSLPEPLKSFNSVPEYVQRRKHKRRSSCPYGPR